MPDVLEVSAPAPVAPVADSDSMFSMIDAAAGNPPAKEEPKSPPKEAPKPAKAESPKAEQKPTVKPAELKKDVPKPEPIKEGKEVKAPEEDVKPEGKKTPWQIVNELREENRQLKARTVQPKEDPEKKTILEERDRLRQRTEELENEFRYVNYEKSPEFKEKYLQPYTDLQQRLTSEAQELFVEGVDGNVRALTSEEFWKVATQPDLESAVKAARELFHDDASKVNLLVAMRKEIKRSWEAMSRAKDDYRIKGAERERQLKQQQAEVSTKERAEFERLNSEAAERFPQYFKEEDGDEKGNELLLKGFALADEAFAAEKANLKRDSAIRNMAGAFPRLRYKYETLSKAHEELKAKLEQFENSVPGGGQVEADKAPKEKTMDDMIDAAAS